MTPSNLTPSPVARAVIIAVCEDPNRTAQIKCHLDHSDLEVYLFASSRDALIHSAEQPPDLFIADVSAGTTEGWQLCQRIQNFTSPSLRPLPMLVLADHPDEAGREKIRQNCGALTAVASSQIPEALLTQTQRCISGSAAAPVFSIALISRKQPLLQQLEDTFEPYATSLVSAPAVAKAGRYFESAGIDLLVIDLDGADTLSSVEKWTTAFPHLIVIALSAKPNPALAWACFQGGARDLIRMPLDAEHIVQVSLAHLQQHRHASSTRPDIAPSISANSTQASYRTLLEAGTQGQILLDRRGHPLVWNPAAASLAQDLLIAPLRTNRSFLDLLPTGYSNWNHLSPSSISSGHAFDAEIKVWDRTHQLHWIAIQGRSTRDASGVVEGICLTIHNTTASHLAQQASETARKQLQALFDHSLDAILLIDDHGSILDSNPALVSLISTEPTVLTGRPLQALFDAKQTDLLCPNWIDGHQPGRNRGERQIQHSSGILIDIEFEATANIQPSVHMVILREITERKALQQHLLNQQRMESVGRLASGVAHDLNNILTPILMAPAMLRAHISDSRSLSLLETIENGAKRGAAIVRQLLDYSRAHPGERKASDLQNITRTAIDMVRERLPNQTKIEAPMQAGEFPLEVDSAQLHQVIIHLMLNAAESMSKGGEIRVYCENVDVGPVEANRHPDAKPGPHVKLTIVDSGCGISLSDENQIFDPFFTTKGFGSSSGLGLSVVLGIVQSHGGFINVKSKVGVGTVVSVLLPRLTVELSPASPAIPALSISSPDGSGAKLGRERLVLVVDDAETMCQIVRAGLVHQGFRVTTAANADAAFAQLSAFGNEIELAIIDLVMPGVKQNQFIEQIAQRYPHIPLLAMTGSHLSPSHTSRLRSLTRGILKKPFDGPRLLETVEHALPSPTHPVPELVTG